MDTKQLVEELNSLIEDELVDDFEDVEVSDNHLSEEPVEEISLNSLVQEMENYL